MMRIVFQSLDNLEGGLVLRSWATGDAVRMVLDWWGQLVVRLDTFAFSARRPE